MGFDNTTASYLNCGVGAGGVGFKGCKPIEGDVPPPPPQLANNIVPNNKQCLFISYLLYVKTILYSTFIICQAY